MPRGWIVAACLCLAGGWASPVAAAQSGFMILALGDTAFLNAGAVRAETGAEVKNDLAQNKLTDFTVVVLANVAYPTLPGPVQHGLAEYVSQGGALLLTGGPQAYGSGGYQAVAPLVPFQIRSASDWRSIPFRPPVVLQSGHPILAGVEFITVGAVNDMNPRPGTSEILQAAGGGSAGGGSYPYPLIAEMGVGAGRVLGMAVNLNDLAGMRDRDRFVQNTMAYLVGVSRLGRNP